MFYRLWTTLYYGILYYFFPFIFVILEAFIIRGIIIAKVKGDEENIVIIDSSK